MDPRLNRYATRSVPRYTSYPTAPHFDASVGEAVQAARLAALDPLEPISLYVHVPFCRQACWYCGCNMKLAAKYEPVASYADTLLAEIALVARHLPARIPVSHLHFGGGTPTALSPDDLARIMAALRETFDFLPGAELAIESDPRTLEADMVRRIGAEGFTRASFGVQEFDPQVQIAINRVQPPEMVRSAVDKLRGAGVSGINFDLIFGLPYQDVAKMVDSVAVSVGMKPDRVALFGYAHVPWKAKRQRMIPQTALPGPRTRTAQAEAAAEAFTEAGYVPIGIDHFARAGDGLALAAKAGKLRRNFQGYTTDPCETLLGFGATSIGRTKEGYVQNIAETGAWARAIGEGRLPIAKGCSFAGEDRLRADVIEALMCSGVADLDALAREHGAVRGWEADAIARLAELVADGIVEFRNSEIRVTEEGRPLARLVASCFDSYLGAQQARHSVAV